LCSEDEPVQLSVAPLGERRLMLS
ncbi:hypothetical protein KIPB_010070, partial [Kipferlia bialata]